MDPFNNCQVHLSLLQSNSVIECTFVLTLLSDRFVCSSSRLQPCGPWRASAQPWWCCGDPGPLDPGPGYLYRNPQFYRSHWICTKGPCQAFGCFTPVSPSYWSYKNMLAMVWNSFCLQSNCWFVWGQQNRKYCLCFSLAARDNWSFWLSRREPAWLKLIHVAQSQVTAACWTGSSLLTSAQCTGWVRDKQS